jgi:hypothetical protein
MAGVRLDVETRKAKGQGSTQCASFSILSLSELTVSSLTTHTDYCDQKRADDNLTLFNVTIVTGRLEVMHEEVAVI